MNKLFVLLVLLFGIVSCSQKDNKEKKNKVDKIKISRFDSIKIYETIRKSELEKSQTKKKVVKFLDSLERNDEDMYEVLLDEVKDRELWLE